MAALHKLRIATLDISKAYLQATYLERDIYMRPPNGFESRPGELWKILKPAYGLVESGRLWQITVEPWMIDSYGPAVVPGLPQLFVLRDEEGPPLLLIANVIDDFLLCGLDLTEIFPLFGVPSQLASK